MTKSICGGVLRERMSMRGLLLIVVLAIAFCSPRSNLMAQRSGGSSGSLTVSTNVWIGGDSDWFTEASWLLFLDVFDLPNPDLPTYFGTNQLFVNGVPTNTFYLPTGEANLAADFSTDWLQMAAFDGPSQITITGGSTLTTTAGGVTIGESPSNFYVPSGPVIPARITLRQNASINGNIIVGVDQAGQLNIAEGGTTINNLTLGQSVGGIGGLFVAADGSLVLPNIVNGGAGEQSTIIDGLVTISSSVRSSALSTWRIQNGGETVFDNSASFTRFGSDVTSLITDSGGLITKTGTGTSTVAWDIVNNGLIDVQGGLFSSSATFSGTGAAMIAANARFRLGGELSGNPELELNGLGVLELFCSNPDVQTLSLTGTFNVRSGTNANQVSNLSVENLGDATATDLLGASGDNTWQNTGGSVMRISGGGNYSLSSNASGEILHDDGATIIKTGTSTFSSSWDLVNNGLIDVQEGLLSSSGAYSGSGSATIAANARFRLGGELDDDPELDVNGLGVLELFCSNPDVQTLSLTGTFNVRSGTNANQVSNLSVENLGDATATDLLGASGDNSWQNVDGSVMRIPTGGNFSLSSGALGEIANNDGATIIKTGTGTFSSSWDLINNGLIDVQEGLLSSNGTYSGSGMATVAANARFRLGGELGGDPELDVNGLGVLELFCSNPDVQTLSLTGTFNVRSGTNANQVSNLSIENLGDATATDLLGASGNNSWQNVDGSVMRIPTGGNFSLSSGALGEIANNDGATIIKTGTGTFNSTWDLINNGLIDVQEGLLSSNGTYSGSGVATVAASARFRIGGELGGNPELDVNGAGVLELFCSNPDVQTLSLTGTFNLRSGTNANQVSNLSVENLGDATATDLLGASGDNSWQNTDGSVMRMPTGGNFSLSSGALGEIANNDGATIIKTGTSTFNSVWDLENSGLVEVQSGAMTFSGETDANFGTFAASGGTLTINDDVSNLSLMTTGASGKIDINGVLTNEVTGQITGFGEIEANSLLNSGRISPGESEVIGQLLVDADAVFQNQSVLEIEMDPTESDRVDVEGNLMVDGVFSVGLLDGHIPNSIDEITVTNASGTLTGAFDFVGNGQTLYTKEGTGLFIVNYGPGSTFDPDSIVLSNFIYDPFIFTVLNGTLASGGVPQLDNSDNWKVSIRRNTADIQSRAIFEVERAAAFSTPSSFSFTLEANVFARSEVTQTIELFDYVANSYVEVSSRAARRLTDLVTTVSPTGDLSRFVNQADNQVKARIKFLSANPRQQFTANIDHVEWVIQP